MTRCLCALLLLLLLASVCRPAAAQVQATDRRYWGVSEYLFPTDRPGLYDLCLDRHVAGAFTAVPRLQELHAEAQDLGTLKSFPARVSLLPAPVPTQYWKQIGAMPSRSWIGLRWNTAGLKPGLYNLQVSVPCDTADSAGQPITIPISRDASLPVYLPEGEDALQAARTKYVGKRVWPRTGLQPVQSDSVVFQFSERTSLRVKSITRTALGFADLAMNGGYGPGWDMSPADFVTHAPLRVMFDRPRHLEVIGFAVSGRTLPKAKSEFFQDFADPWQLDRALGLTPPRRFQPPKLGMTPKQVIDTLGWPTEYGSLDQLTQRASWRYDTLKPFHATAYFSHGKFVRYDPGGHLP